MEYTQITILKIGKTITPSKGGIEISLVLNDAYSRPAQANDSILVLAAGRQEALVVTYLSQEAKSWVMLEKEAQAPRRYVELGRRLAELWASDPRDLRLTTTWLEITEVAMHDDKRELLSRLISFEPEDKTQMRYHCLNLDMAESGTYLNSKLAAASARLSPQVFPGWSALINKMLLGQAQLRNHRPVTHPCTGIAPEQRLWSF